MAQLLTWRLASALDVSAVSGAAAEIPATPEDGGPRLRKVIGVAHVLNLRERPSLTAKIIATYKPGTLLDNPRYQATAGGIWCDVPQLGGGRRGYVGAQYLNPAISPDGTPAMGPDDSALRAGLGDFDATRQIPCAQSAGQPMTQCTFGVARAGGGDASVAVIKPYGRTRIIFFRNGLPIGADTSEADAYGELRATKENDLHRIGAGDERYEIPDAVPLGG
jgi:hypothetical protein